MFLTETFLWNFLSFLRQKLSILAFFFNSRRSCFLWGLACESLLILMARCTFEEKLVVTVLAKLVQLFPQKCTCAFFFRTRSLTDRSQIVTDTCKNYVSNFVGSLLNRLYHYANENVSVKHLSLICITSILTTIIRPKLFSLWRVLP